MDDNLTIIRQDWASQHLQRHPFARLYNLTLYLRDGFDHFLLPTLKRYCPNFS